MREHIFVVLLTHKVILQNKLIKLESFIFNTIVENQTFTLGYLMKIHLFENNHQTIVIFCFPRGRLAQW